jgi:hypothetical protein
MNDLFVRMYVELGPAIVLVRHPMVVHIDDETFAGHYPYL